MMNWAVPSLDTTALHFNNILADTMLHERYAIPGLQNLAFIVRNGIACIALPTVHYLEQFCMHRHYCMQAVVSITWNSEVVCYAYSSVHYSVEVCYWECPLIESPLYYVTYMYVQVMYPPG